MNHPSNNTQAVKLTGEEVAKHNNADSCWVIVHGRAYDVTEFLPEHPGGPKIILKYAGKDASEEYDPIHPPDTLDKFLDKGKHLGEVDMNTVQQETKEEDPDEAERQERIKRMPILEQCYNLMDFEAVAKRVMKKTAWAYYSSGADDEIVSLITSQYSDFRLPFNRRCVKITAPSTRSGSDLRSSLMSRRSTCRQQCWVPKSACLST
jgi:L-lactate dehydrogenase (cytochrome)